MEFMQSTQKDLEAIFHLYDEAVAFQKTVSNKHWKPFDRELVQTEINEGRQWKILENGEIACIFVIAYSDPFIWGERGHGKAVYIHRIVTNPAFRGGNYVQHIVNWARQHVKETGNTYIRMDTWGDNQRLIEYYTSCGFTFLGVFAPDDISLLPKHYSDITLAFFEMEVQ
jgi:Acetyltransferases